MSDNSTQLQPGTLWEVVVHRTRHALACGALRPIETDTEFVEQGGVRFMVRVVASLARKDAVRRRAEQTQQFGRAADPFLPYEQDLFVAEVSDTHLCLLNKFNVIDHHLLIVTRRFEDQELLLTPADFEALWACMAEFEALGFYNGGMIAGASQRHKHLQMVPLPLTEEGPCIPVEPLLAAAELRESVGTVPGLPFVHACARLDSHLVTDPVAAARVSHKHYRIMLEAVGLGAVQTPEGLRQSAPYNLLVTRTWMLLVPRTREFFNGISVNALGYAGSLFVRDREQLEIVRAQGPMTVLREVSVAAPR